MKPATPAAATATPEASKLHRFEAGGYAFVEGNFRYSQAIAALPGHRLRRVRFARPLPMAEGFAAIAEHLARVGRPPTALAACELRCAQPYELAGFDVFNRDYGKTLLEWGLQHDGLNPVARSNVAPQYEPPSVQSLYAFTYALPGTFDAPAATEFVVAGSGEWPETMPFPESVIARGDLSPAGMRRKAEWVIAAMRQRVAALHADWSAITACNVYTVHDFHATITPLFGPSGLTHAGLTWQLCSPPIVGLDFEMDLRCVREEWVLP